MQSTYDLFVHLYTEYGAYVIFVIVIFIEYKFRPLYRLYKLNDIVAENNQMHLKLQSDLLDIKTTTANEVSEIRNLLVKEFSHNGGMSIKDALRRTEEAVNLLMAQQNISLNLHDRGIFMCDNDGKNFYVNRKFAEILDCDKSELMNYGWQNFVTDLSSYNIAYKQAFEVKRVFIVNLPMVTSNGKEVICHIEAHPLDGLDGYMGYISLISK